MYVCVYNMYCAIVNDNVLSEYYYSCIMFNLYLYYIQYNSYVNIFVCD